MKIALSHREITDFFGCPFDQLNRLIQLMVLYDDDERFPEWMRGLQRYADLPRSSKEQYEHQRTVSGLYEGDIALRAKWIIESLEDGAKWSLLETGFSFEEQHDAVMFALRWTGVLPMSEVKRHAMFRDEKQQLNLVEC